MSVVFSWNENDFQKLIANCPDEPVTPHLMRYLNKEWNILEAGCGSGRFVYYLNSLGYNVQGIEINTETVSVLNKKFPNLKIQYGDVTKLPFTDSSLDAIISLGVIEHVVEGIDGPINEMYRVLKNGGIAFVIVPSFNLVRRIKHRLGILHFVAAIRYLKDSTIIRSLFGKGPKGGDRVPKNSPYKTWPIFGTFYEYRFIKHEFENELVKGKFEILESIPVSLIDGLYQEFGPLFVRLKNHTFYPNTIGRWLNSLLSRYPFVHNHMHLCIVVKR